MCLKRWTPRNNIDERWQWPKAEITFGAIIRTGLCVFLKRCIGVFLYYGWFMLGNPGLASHLWPMGGGTRPKKGGKHHYKINSQLLITWLQSRDHAIHAVDPFFVLNLVRLWSRSQACRTIQPSLPKNNSLIPSGRLPSFSSFFAREDILDVEVGWGN